MVNDGRSYAPKGRTSSKESGEELQDEKAHMQLRKGQAKLFKHNIGLPHSANRV